MPAGLIPVKAAGAAGPHSAGMGTSIDFDPSRLTAGAARMRLRMALECGLAEGLQAVGPIDRCDLQALYDQLDDMIRRYGIETVAGYVLDQP